MQIRYLPKLVSKPIMHASKIQKPSKDFNPLRPIYTAFAKNQQLKDFDATIIAVNIDTIIRAIIQKQNIQNAINIRLILPDIQNELLQMLDSSIEYFESQLVSSQLINDYYFFLYKVDYSYIPEEYKRSNKTNALVATFSDMLIADTTILDEIENTIYSRTYYIRPNIHIVQSINTYGIVNKLSNVLSSKVLKPNNLEFGTRMIFISHYPPDYHVNNAIRYLVIDSFTGNIWDKNTLPVKLFKHEYLTFNKLTHAIFGDKHILRPAIPTQYRRKLLNNIQLSCKVWDNNEILMYLNQVCPTEYITNLLRLVESL